MLLDNLKLSSAKRNLTGRRFLRSGRVRRWMARFWIAAPGFAFEMYGIGRPATDYSRIWHSCGLLFFLAAATLPLWRKPEPERGPSLPSPRRWRELQRRVCWRVGAMLLLGANFALIANRWDVWHGDRAAAQVFGGVGLVVLLLSPIPPLLDPLLWRAWPWEVRRVARAARVVEELSKSAPLLTAEFAPDRGAAGRPRPLAEYGGGAPCAKPVSVAARQTWGGSPAVVEWDGTLLNAVDGRGRAHAIPLAGQRRKGLGRAVRGRRPAVELVYVRNRSPLSGGPERITFTTLFFLEICARLFPPRISSRRI